MIENINNDSAKENINSEMRKFLLGIKKEEKDILGDGSYEIIYRDRKYEIHSHGCVTKINILDNGEKFAITGDNFTFYSDKKDEIIEIALLGNKRSALKNNVAGIFESTTFGDGVDFDPDNSVRDEEVLKSVSNLKISKNSAYLQDNIVNFLNYKHKNYEKSVLPRSNDLEKNVFCIRGDILFDIEVLGKDNEYEKNNIKFHKGLYDSSNDYRIFLSKQRIGNHFDLGHTAIVNLLFKYFLQNGYYFNNKLIHEGFITKISCVEKINIGSLNVFKELFGIEDNKTINLNILDQNGINGFVHDGIGFVRGGKIIRERNKNKDLGYYKSCNENQYRMSVKLNEALHVYTHQLFGKNLKYDDKIEVNGQKMDYIRGDEFLSNTVSIAYEFNAYGGIDRLKMDMVQANIDFTGDPRSIQLDWMTPRYHLVHSFGWSKVKPLLLSDQQLKSKYLQLCDNYKKLSNSKAEITKIYRAKDDIHRFLNECIDKFFDTPDKKKVLVDQYIEEGKKIVSAMKNASKKKKG